MLSFGAPFGLLALLAVPAVVAAYYLRRKQPTRVISALFLWRTPDQRAEAGPALERLSRERSLLLELLAVVAAAAFLSDARCGRELTQTHLVVVVDGSLSMQAVRDGQSNADRVKNAVAALAAQSGAASMTIIESGVRPTVLAGRALETSRALALLEQWVPSQPSHDLGPALQAAKEMAEPNARLEVITDGPVTTELSPQVHVQSVGAPLENLAVVSAQRRDVGGRASVTVRVSNFSNTPQRVPVTFSAPELPAQTQELDLAPGESTVLRASLGTTAVVRVHLPPDALVADGELALPPAAQADVKVELLGSLDEATVASVNRFVSSSSEVQPSGSTVLSVGPPGSSAKVTVGVVGEGARRSFVGPFFAQRTHPALDDVHLAGVIWAAGPNPEGRVLISAGDAVLMSETDDGAIHLNLDLSRSNIQKTEAWPILLGNLVRLARERAAGLPRKQLMLGEDVPVVIAAGGSWLLRHDDGTTQPVLGMGSVTLSPLSHAGHWSLINGGQVVDGLEVLAIDRWSLICAAVARSNTCRAPEPCSPRWPATARAAGGRWWCCWAS